MNKILTPKGIAVTAIAVICLALIGWWIYAAHHGGTAQTGMETGANSSPAVPTKANGASAVINDNAATEEKLYTPAAAVSNETVCTSMGCFTAAAQKCSPATLSWTGVIDVSSLFSENVLSNLSIKGLNEYKECIFTDYVKSASGIVTPQYQIQGSAQGLTPMQMQQQVSNEAQQTTGIISECTFDETTLVRLLTDWSEGPISAGAFSVANCTSVSASGANTTVGPGPGSTAAQAKSGTVTLDPNSDVHYDNLEFQVAFISSASVNMTVVNHTLNQSVAITLNNNGSQPVLGYDLSIVGIKEIAHSSSSGSPTFSNEATVSFTQQQ